MFKFQTPMLNDEVRRAMTDKQTNKQTNKETNKQTNKHNAELQRTAPDT